MKSHIYEALEMAPWGTGEGKEKKKKEVVKKINTNITIRYLQGPKFYL